MVDTGAKLTQVDEIFERYLKAGDCKEIQCLFQQICGVLDIDGTEELRLSYDKLSCQITSWRAKAVWEKLNKRRSLDVYQNGTACANTNVLIIGAGPVGLRTAIEAVLLGCRVVVMEKRDTFSRNNILHLWPFLITDLTNICAKECFPKFGVGGINHISIRQLQCILMKIALILGVKVYLNVGYEGLVEPTTQNSNVGWKCRCNPSDHELTDYEFDVIIGASGSKNELIGFERKELRGKLAIAITINFKRRYTREEAKVQEFGGVIMYAKQDFFRTLNETLGIELENVVYYKGETHYFVMTAKKQSLIKKGVLKSDQSNADELLSRENVNHDILLNYALQVAKYVTEDKLSNLEVCVNHQGQPDVAMFDFTSMYYSENASHIIDRNGHKLLLGVAGDSLIEPFWPQGTGCGRGFLAAFDVAWMIRNWAAQIMTPLEIITERESLYQQLISSALNTSSALNKDFDAYTIDPKTRYNCLCTAKEPNRVKHLYDSDQDIRL